MVSDDFSKFWTQLSESDYSPKLCTVAKACLFESDISKLGELGDGLVTEVWWTGDFPFVSSLDGTTSAELAQDYLENCQPELTSAPATVGYKYANVEILYDILTRAGTLNLDAVNQAAKETNLDTMVGHVSFNENHVSLMSCVAGQWILDEDGSYHQEIVGNYLIPSVETTATIKLLEN
jgi:branched-chain amino acid transport system substrate-binding protein